MKIFLTGAQGFIGRVFCGAAAERGHEVLGLGRSGSVRLTDKWHVVRGSLDNVPWEAVKQFAPDAALHLAWIATPGIYLNSPENEMFATQSEKLFAGLIREGVRHIAGVGTCIEYAASAEPLVEDSSPLGATFPYSRAKVETCSALREIAGKAEVAWSWLRLFYPYGEGEHPDRLPSALMRMLMAGQTLELKTPDSVKDYIHVADAAEALLDTLEKRLTGAVNIGTGEGISVMSLAQAIARECGCAPQSVKRANPGMTDPFPVTIADVTKLRSTGWRQQVSLEEGLKRLRKSLL